MQDPPIKANGQYKGYNNEDGDEATGDTCSQATKQKPLKKRPAGQAKTNLPDKAKSQKIKKETIKKLIKENDQSKGCSKCRYGKTGCMKCNPIKKAAYERKQNEKQKTN